MLTLPELYAQSDYITLHVAITTETYGMLNDAAFAKMRKGVRIVNCARGELIDGESLRRAIESGKVAGAALDVYDVEPLPKDHPILALDNTILTPHLGYATEEAYRVVYAQVVEAIRGHLAGKIVRPINKLG